MKKILAVLLAFSALPAIAADTRGLQASANAYRQNQRNNYYLITQPDIDSECRGRIHKCLSDYCGSLGTTGLRCDYVTDGELYNWALLCLQRDFTPLLPQYNANTAAGKNGLNSAARLCPSYVQSELMAFLSSMNLADKLVQQRSEDCIARRAELSIAMACHQVALAYGQSTQNRLVSELTMACGDTLPGGSTAMVQRFANAGNLGANIMGWAEKIVSGDLSRKGTEWQTATDRVLLYYANRMNLACGENMQLNLPARSQSGAAEGNPYPTLTTLANIALDTYSARQLEEMQSEARANAPIESIWTQVYSMSEVYDFATAKQVVNAGLTNSPLTQNAFLTSAQMSAMQDNYKYGTKIFVLKDSARCFIVPVRPLTSQEQSASAQVFTGCAAQ